VTWWQILLIVMGGIAAMWLIAYAIWAFIVFVVLWSIGR
jgi:hypothetical protein